MSEPYAECNFDGSGDLEVRDGSRGAETPLLFVRFRFSFVFPVISGLCLYVTTTWFIFWMGQMARSF
jgi:hypothetical protein